MLQNKKYQAKSISRRTISLMLLLVLGYITFANIKNFDGLKRTVTSIEKAKKPSNEILLFEEDELDERLEDTQDEGFELLPSLLSDQFHFGFHTIQFNCTNNQYSFKNFFYQCDIFLNIRNLRI